MKPATQEFGRPRNLFGNPPRDFKLWWENTTQYEVPFVSEPGIGTVGYLLDKMREPIVRLTLTPTDAREEAHYWVKLQTHDSSIVFAPPYLCALHDIERLIELWEFDDAVWVEGAVASATYPEGWKLPGTYSGCPKRFRVLMHDAKRGFTHHVTAGLHSLRGNSSTMQRLQLHPEARLAGVFGEADDLDSLIPLLEGLTSFPKLVLGEEHVNRCRKASARCFRQRLLQPPPSKTYPFIPHAELLGLPVSAVGEYEP